MPFSLKLHERAVKSFKQLDSQTQKRLKKRLNELRADPFTKKHSTDIKKLKGIRGRQDLFRLRVGDYRIIYTIEDKTIFVTSIFHREKGYDWLN